MFFINIPLAKKINTKFSPRPVLPVKATVLYGFGQVMVLYFRGIIQIGNSAGNLQDTIIGTGR